MNRLKDAWLELRIRIALHLFIHAQKTGDPASYELMHAYFELCKKRKASQVKRMEERFM